MTKFELKVPPLPKVPNTVPTYRTIKPSIERQRESIERLGKSIGLKKGVKGGFERDEIFAVQEEEHILEVYKESGAVWYGDMAKLWQEKPMDYRKAFGVREKIEVEKKIRSISEDFLKRNELIPKEAYFIGTTEAEFARLEEGEKTAKTTICGMQANFGFKLGDIPVVGSGAKITVNFGSDGKVVGFFKAWREVKRDKELTLLLPEMVVEKFLGSRIFADLGADSKVTIKEFYLAYYTLPVIEQQDYLLPVYVFEGEVETSHFKSVFTRYASAVSLDVLKSAGVLVDSEVFPDPDLL